MVTKRNIVITACACLIALLVGPAVEGVVEKTSATRRPFKVYGDATVQIDWSDIWYDDDGRLYVPWTMTAQRVCTEGWFTDEGQGVLYLDDGTMVGSGMCSENDGGLVTWESLEQWGTQHVSVKITGGHGPFEGVAGSFGYDYTVIKSELDGNGNPRKLMYSFWGKGVTISK